MICEHCGYRRAMREYIVCRKCLEMFLGIRAREESK
jgi:hypothetical protein